MQIPELFFPIVTVLGVVATFLTLIRKYFIPAKEVADILISVYDAVKDGKITKEELENIKTEAYDLKKAIRSFKNV